MTSAPSLPLSSSLGAAPSAAPDSSALASEPPIDAASLADLQALAESGEEDNVLAELIGLFLGQAPATLDQLGAAVAQGDAAAAVAAAHLLKSNAGHFGAHRLFDLCGQVETSARRGDLTEAPARFHLIQAEFRRVLHALEEHFPNRPL